MCLKAFTSLLLQALFSPILPDLNHVVLSPPPTFFRIHRDLVSVPANLSPRTRPERHRRWCRRIAQLYKRKTLERGLIRGERTNKAHYIGFSQTGEFPGNGLGSAFIHGIAIHLNLKIVGKSVTQSMCSRVGLIFLFFIFYFFRFYYKYREFPKINWVMFSDIK